jgi:hypothetical protein
VEEDKNPYAPPVETEAEEAMVPTRTSGTLTISHRGWEIVTSMSRWMRIVSTLQYVGAALAGVGFLALVGFLTFNREMLTKLGEMGSGPQMAGVVGVAIVLPVLVVMLFLGAMWLRSAAQHFHDGILSNAEQPLARGFRALRKYLILYGIFGILGMLGEFFGLLGN